jgi:hypothetical protein
VRGSAALRALALASALGPTAGALGAPCLAQVEASLDATASVVKYDGYLSSGAVALTPSVAWRSPRTALAGRGSFLVFESGNTSIQGLVSAATFSPPLGRLRLEAAAEAGASVYAGFARFAHALGRVRLHAMGTRAGAWGGPLAGRLSRGHGGEDALGVSAGGWVRFAGATVDASWTRLTVGDTAFSDLLGRARWSHGAFDVTGSAGTRVASRGGGKGFYGDVTATLRLTDGLALVIGGGTYPSDPVRGSIPGRYVTAGVRLAPRAAVQPVVLRQIGAPPGGAPAVAGARRARVAVEQLGGLAVLVVRVSGAARVEVMGDFTDWRPVTLSPTGDGGWQYALPLPPGMHRFNIRLDGGSWGVPAGAGYAADEFGGGVGVLIVP